MIKALKHWRTTAAAVAALLTVLAKWPDIDRHDVETMALAVGVFLAADASAANQSPAK